MPDITPICWLCKKPIKDKVYYQAGNWEFPSHRNCLVKAEPARPKGKPNA